MPQTTVDSLLPYAFQCSSTSLLGNKSSNAFCNEICQLMLQAKLLEHNVRFGDPECQCLMLRLESDLLELMLNACEHQLDGTALQWSSKAALTVVLAAKGYPGDYNKGTIIEGLGDIIGAKVSCIPSILLVWLHVHMQSHVVLQSTGMPGLRFLDRRRKLAASWMSFHVT